MAVLGFELRALDLQAHELHLQLFAVVTSEIRSHIDAQPGLDHNPPIYAPGSWVVCTTTTSFLLIEMGSRKFFYWTDLNL
jgi:hypothetical protein